MVFSGQVVERMQRDCDCVERRIESSMDKSNTSGEFLACNCIFTFVIQPRLITTGAGPRIVKGVCIVKK